MPERIGKIWRLVATAIAFLTFGIGGLLLQLVGIPLLYLLYPQRQRRQKAARRLVHALFWLYVRFIALLGILRFHVAGAERLERPGLVIAANHPSLLDVVFLLSMVPDATCIVRAGLSGNPFTRAAVRLAGYVCNDSGVELVDACVQALRGGSSLIVFPEGTRTSSAVPGRWHRGAANVALRAGVAVTPVRIGCEPETLRKGEPWWHIPPRRIQYSFRVLEDLPATQARAECENDPQAARILTDQLREMLTNPMERNARA